MAHAHLIESLGFELAFDSEEQAFERQDRVGTFARGRALQVIESVFDTMSRPGQLLRLDRLELDLGPVDAQDLEAELERRLREQLELALRGVWAQVGAQVEAVSTPSPASAGEGRGEGPQPRQLHTAGRGAQNPKTPSPQPSPADAGEGANTARVHTDAQAGLEAVLAYLQHGHLPWHASCRLAAHPVDLLLSWLRDHPAAGRAALQGLPAGSAAWRRLVLQSTPAQRLALARRVAPQSADRVQALVDSLTGAAHERVWAALLPALLADDAPTTLATRLRQGLAPAGPDETPAPVLAQALAVLDGALPMLRATPSAAQRAAWRARVDAGLRTGALAGTEDAWRALLRHDRRWLSARLAGPARQARVRRALAQGLSAGLLQQLVGLWVAPGAQAFIAAFIDALAGATDGDASALWAHTLGHLAADNDLLQPVVFNEPAYVESVLRRSARQRGGVLAGLPAVWGTAGEAAQAARHWLQALAHNTRPAPSPASAGEGWGEGQTPRQPTAAAQGEKSERPSPRPSPADAGEGATSPLVPAPLSHDTRPAPSPASAGEGWGEGQPPRQPTAAAQREKSERPSPRPSPADAGEGATSPLVPAPLSHDTRPAPSPASAGEGWGEGQPPRQPTAAAQREKSERPSPRPSPADAGEGATSPLVPAPLSHDSRPAPSPASAGEGWGEGQPPRQPTAAAQGEKSEHPSPRPSPADAGEGATSPLVPAPRSHDTRAARRRVLAGLAALPSAAAWNVRDWDHLLRHDAPWLRATLQRLGRASALRRRLAAGLDPALLQQVIGLWVGPPQSAFIAAFVPALAARAGQHAALVGLDTPALWADALGQLWLDDTPAPQSADAYVRGVLACVGRRHGLVPARPVPGLFDRTEPVAAAERLLQWLHGTALLPAAPAEPEDMPDPERRSVRPPAPATGDIARWRRRVLAWLRSAAPLDPRDWSGLLHHDPAWLRATLPLLGRATRVRRRLAQGLGPALLRGLVGLWVPPAQRAFITRFIESVERWARQRADLAGIDAPGLWAHLLAHLWEPAGDADAGEHGPVQAVLRRISLQTGLTLQQLVPGDAARAGGVAAAAVRWLGHLGMAEPVAVTPAALPARPPDGQRHAPGRGGIRAQRRRLLAALQAAAALPPHTWLGVLRHDAGWLRATLQRLGQAAAVRQHVAQSLSPALLLELAGLWVAPARQAFIAAFVQGLDAWARQHGERAGIDAPRLLVGLWAGTLMHLWVERPDGIGDDRAYVDSVLRHLGAPADGDVADAAARVVGQIGAAAALPAPQPEAPHHPARGEIRVWRRRLLATLASSRTLERRDWPGLLQHDPAWLRATLQRLGRSARVRRRVAQGLDAALLGELIGLWVAPARRAFMVALVQGLGRRVGLEAPVVWEQVLGEVWLAAGPQSEAERADEDSALAARVLQRLAQHGATVPDAGWVDQVLEETAAAEAPRAGRQQLSAAVASRRFDAGFEGLWFELTRTDALWLRAWLCRDEAGGDDGGIATHPVRAEPVEALVPLAPALRQAQGERGAVEGESRTFPHPVRAEPVEASASLAPTLRQAQGERGAVEGEDHTIPHPVRAEPVEALAPLAPTLRQAQGERGAVEGESSTIPLPVRAEPVEASAPLAPTLRQAQGERGEVEGEDHTIPHPVRAEPVEASAPLAPTLRQAQGERGKVEGEDHTTPLPVRAELVEASAPLAPTLRQAQGERGEVEGESRTTPHPVRAEPVEAWVPLTPTLRQAQGERGKVEGEDHTTPLPVRAEPVEALVPLAPTLRQAQGERGAVEGESRTTPRPVRAEPVEAPAPLAPTLRQAQGERGKVEGEDHTTPLPVRAEPVEALVPLAPTLRQAQGERGAVEGESRTTPRPVRAEPVEASAPLAPTEQHNSIPAPLARLRHHIAQHLPQPRWLQSLAPWLPPADSAALAAAIHQLAQTTPAPHAHETRLWERALARLWYQPRQRLDLPAFLQTLMQEKAQANPTPPLNALQSPAPLPAADAERWRTQWRALPAPARAAWRQPLRLALETPPAATRLAELLPPDDLAEVLQLLRPDAHARMQAAAALVTQACQAASLAPPEQTEPLAWQFILREAIEEDRAHHDPAHTTAFATRLVADLAHRLAPAQPQHWHQTLVQALADGSPTSTLRQSLAQALRTQVLPLPDCPDPPWLHAPSAPLEWDDLAEGDAIHIANAGLVLAGPYLPRLLRMLGLADANAFTPPEAAERAVHLLQVVVDANPETAEPLLVLNKLLCGLPLAAPIPRGITPTAQETTAINGMLQAMILHWATLGNTSIAGLRETFLQREGRLLRKADAWHLVVQHSPLDVLLDRLPWGYATIKYPWMDEVLHVDWR